AAARNRSVRSEAAAGGTANVMRPAGVLKRCLLSCRRCVFRPRVAKRSGGGGPRAAWWSGQAAPRLTERPTPFHRAFGRATPRVVLFQWYGGRRPPMPPSSLRGGGEG